MENKSFVKHRFAGELKAGEAVDDVFALTDKALGKKRDGTSYLSLTLTDRTGSVKAVMWEDADRAAAEIRKGGLVRIRGSVSEYQEQLQVVVKDALPFPEEKGDPEVFLPKTRRNIDVMFERLVRLSKSLEDVHLKALLAAFFEDATLMEAFKKAPAAKMMHHAYLGGLLEHTLSMALLSDAVAGHYGGIDRDLLLAGAVLHDIGKIREFVYHHVIDYSDAGRLLGHILMGIRMIDEKMAEIKDFPAEKAMLLKHLVLSHHGNREYGSPEVPKTMEAVLLHYIDEIDSKINGIREYMESNNPGEPWTAYHRVLERHFFWKKD